MPQSVPKWVTSKGNPFGHRGRHHYRQRNLKLDVVVANSVEDFIGGHKRKIGQFKLSGVMSLVEGKQPMTFDGYRFLALNAI